MYACDEAKILNSWWWQQFTEHNNVTQQLICEYRFSDSDSQVGSGQFLNTVHHEYGDVSGFSVLENLNTIRLLIRFTTKVYARGLAGVGLVVTATLFSRNISTTSSRVGTGTVEHNTTHQNGRTQCGGRSWWWWNVAKPINKNKQWSARVLRDWAILEVYLRMNNDYVWSYLLCKP